MVEIEPSGRARSRSRRDKERRRGELEKARRMKNVDVKDDNRGRAEGVVGSMWLPERREEANEGVPRLVMVEGQPSKGKRRRGRVREGRRIDLGADPVDDRAEGGESNFGLDDSIF